MKRVLLIIATLMLLNTPGAAASDTPEPLADCTAILRPETASWTAECSVAPHMISIRVERWWYHFQNPSQLYYDERVSTREVVPGTAWSERVYFLPEQRILFMCLTGFQDGTVLIAPRQCASRA